ncbi:MAG: flagellar basal body P-ring formation chaperone FlgA [Burkholderiaceae bacterium]
MPSVVEPSLLLRFAGAFFVCAALALGAAPARAVDEPATAADSAQAAPLAERVQQFAQQAARAGAPDVRVQVDLGALDTRLKLAPCARISPYLPSGTKLWGASRIGVRCDEGARWNVYLPVRVKVYAQAVVLRQPLAAGTVIEPAHLAQAEVDLAAEPAPVLRREADVLGRALARPLASGAAVRQSDLRARQWFAAGDVVRIVARGAGYAVVSEGQALAPGLEGQTSRVRTEGGRIVTGRASGPRQLELTL